MLINPSWEVYTSQHILYFIHSGGKMLSVHTGTAEMEKLVTAITSTGTTAIAILSKETGIAADKTAAGVAFLQQHNIIIPDEAERMQAQLSARQWTVQAPFLYFLQDNYTATQQYTLPPSYFQHLRKHITIIGLGATGSLTAQLLISCGFRNIRLVDGDQVEIKNLGRQFLYKQEDNGSYKTTALKTQFLQYDPEVNIQTSNDYINSKKSAVAAVQNSDFVLLTADKPRLKIHRWIDEACRQQQIPYLRTMFNQVGPIYVPGTTPCFNCIEQHWLQQHTGYNDISSADPLLKSRTLPASPFHVTAAASFYAEEIFRFLTGMGTPASMSGMITFKDNGMQVQQIPFSKQCNCKQ